MKLKSILFYLQLIASVVLILWGLDGIGRLIKHPELISSWWSVILVLAGIFVGFRVCYVHRKGAVLLGITLMVFAGIYLWNMQYYFGYEHITSNDIFKIFGIPLTILIGFGVFLSVFFRYLYPSKSTDTEVSSTEKTSKETIPVKPEITITRKTISKKERGKNPWIRLLFLAASAGLAVLIGHLSGIEDPVERTKIIMSVLILGCVATGLISEKTLTKISSWVK